MTKRVIANPFGFLLPVMRYRYSKEIVYNTFPWCHPTDAQKAKIEETSQAILDARALYPDCSLADLYDEVAMPPELRKAHQAKALLCLAKERREILFLRFYLGYSDIEIGKLIGRCRSSVNRRNNYALRLLRKEMEALQNEE